MKPTIAPLGGKRILGFTLVEIVVAMTILALISGTVLATLIQAGDVAADIRDTDQKDEEISRFLSLLAQTIESLPEDAAIEMVPPSESVSGFYEMKISNAIGAFLFGEDTGTAGELIIGLQPQASETGDDSEFLELAISRESYAPVDTDGDGMVFGAGTDDFLAPDSEGRYWLPLVSNIISAAWRYWDETSRSWLDTWEEDNLPPLMELVIEDSHRPAPLRTVFELPEHLVKETAAQTDAATDNSASTAASSAADSTGGQAPNAGQGTGQVNPNSGDGRGAGAGKGGPRRPFSGKGSGNEGRRGPGRKGGDGSKGGNGTNPAGTPPSGPQSGGNAQ